MKDWNNAQNLQHHSSQIWGLFCVLNIGNKICFKFAGNNCNQLKTVSNRGMSYWSQYCHDALYNRSSQCKDTVQVTGHCGKTTNNWPSCQGTTKNLSPCQDTMYSWSPCHSTTKNWSSQGEERETNKMQLIWYLLSNISTCFGYHYAHHQENKTVYCRIWCSALLVLAVVAWSWGVSCVHCVKVTVWTVTFTQCTQHNDAWNILR